MTQADSGRRRRAEDFKANNTAENDDLFPGQDRRAHTSPRRRTPGRSFLRKFKQPIIGLSLAGAAAPLINSGTSPSDEAAHKTEGQQTEADLARQAAATTATGQKMDAEDQLATRIATEQTNVESASLVDHAIDKYGIDDSLAKDIYDVAQQEGISPKLAYGLVHTESSFQTRARSGVGARGLTQVMPKTAQWLKPGTKPDDLWDQHTNLQLGFRYLNQLIDKYHGNVRHALLAYNRGPGTVDKILKRGGNPNNGYADKVLGGAVE